MYYVNESVTRLCFPAGGVSNPVKFFYLWYNLLKVKQSEISEYQRSIVGLKCRGHLLHYSYILWVEQFLLYKWKEGRDHLGTNQLTDSDKGSGYEENVRTLQVLCVREVVINMLETAMSYLHMHMHMHAHSHTCAHTYIHTYIHTYVYTHVHMHTYVCMHMCTHVRMYVHVHTCTYVCTCAHMYVRMYMCTHVRTYVHVHTCTYVCTCAHMYVQLTFWIVFTNSMFNSWFS